MIDYVLEQIKSRLGAGISLVVLGIAAAAMITYKLPRYIVTTEIFAGEKYNIYQAIKSGDDWQRLNMIEMELRSLTERKWLLEDRVDKNTATPRDRIRLQEINVQINNLKIEMNRIKTNLKGVE